MKFILFCTLVFLAASTIAIPLNRVSKWEEMRKILTETIGQTIAWSSWLMLDLAQKEDKEIGLQVGLILEKLGHEYKIITDKILPKIDNESLTVEELEEYFIEFKDMYKKTEAKIIEPVSNLTGNTAFKIGSKFGSTALYAASLVQNMIELLNEGK